MKILCVVIILVLIVVFSSFPSNELIQKYKHRYTTLVESDVDSIVALLSSPDTVIVREASVLVNMAFRKGFESARKAIPKLLELAETSPSAFVRRSAAGALIRSRDPAAQRILLDIARDEDTDPFLRAIALDGLVSLGIATEEAMLIASLNLRAEDEWLRARSIIVLSNSEDPDDLSAVLRAYVNHYEDPDTALMSKAPLPITIHMENAYEYMSYLFGGAVRGIAYREPDLLNALVMHPDSRIRLDVGRAFEARFDGRALDAVAEVLINEEDWELRLQAAEILGSSRRYAEDRFDRVVAALKLALEDPYVEERPEGLHRPVAARAYKGLRKLGIEVEKPKNILWPEKVRAILE